MSNLSEPLTPADCDLRDFAFIQIDVKRLLSSETWILGNGDERAAAIALWMESWHQVPAASMPDNDRMLDHLSQSKAWKKSRAHALRGWIKCSDGRLYHPVVAEKALEAWIEKLINSISGSVGNAKRWGLEIDTDAISVRIIEAAGLLRNIAPRSKTLQKKQVVAIISGSPPDKKFIAPRSENVSSPDPEASPPDDFLIAPRSAEDRKGQGQGQGYIKTTSLSESTVDTPTTPQAAEKPHDERSIDSKPENPKPENARSVQIAILLRMQGIKPLTSAHPDAIAWAGNPAVTDDLLNAAVETARHHKPAGDISPAYIRPIVEQMLNPPPPRQRNDAQAPPLVLSEKRFDLPLPELGKPNPEQLAKVKAEMEKLRPGSIRRAGKSDG